jgi:hypothetical protein
MILFTNNVFEISPRRSVGEQQVVRQNVHKLLRVLNFEKSLCGRLIPEEGETQGIVRQDKMPVV